MKCFQYNKKNNATCKVASCRYWINHKESNNCCINYEKREKTTLEDVGKIFNVTRMRICQIEKIAISKVKTSIKNLLLLD